MSRTLRVMKAEAIEWTRAFLAVIPGKIGLKLREFYFARLLDIDGAVIVREGFYCEGGRNISLGDQVGIDRHCSFVADTSTICVGAGTKFNCFVQIIASHGGNIRIGKNCLIGPNVIMRSANHRYSDLERPIIKQGHESDDIIIEDDVWLGASVVILPGVTIGKGNLDENWRIRF